MSKQVQRRRGTATQHTSFTGAEGEISVNTTNKSTHVHDGVTAGGIETARADLDNVSSADVLAAAGVTASAAELNRVDGVTSPIQTQIDAKAPKDGAVFTGGVDVTGDLSFGDNDKAIFGAGSDLQIYHDGDNSYVKDAGDGVLNVQGSSQVNIGGANGTIGVQFVEGANVALRHNNVNKFSTTSTGVDVTGTLTSDALTVDGAGTSPFVNFSNGVDSAPNRQLAFSEKGGSGLIYKIDSTGASGLFGQLVLATNGTDRINLASNGDVSFYEDTGTTPALTWDASAQSLNVDGPITSDGLTVDGSSAGRVTSAEFKNNLNAGGTEVAINLANQGGTSNADVNLVANRVGANFGSDFYIETSDGVDGTNRKRLNVGENGDISFYEDTGTTAKFFWDASAESLSIGAAGTVGVGESLYLAGGGAVITGDLSSYNVNALMFGYDGSNAKIAVGGNSGASRGMTFSTVSGGVEGERMRIDSSGRVGINTSSPAAPLEVSTSSADYRIQFTHSSGQNKIKSVDSNQSTFRDLYFDASQHFFQTSGTERMRIDSSGNVLVGTTDTDPAYNNVTGAAVRPDGYATSITGEGGIALRLNRKANDGSIVEFRKDGTTVGSIGAFNGDLSIGTGDTALRFHDGGNRIEPFNVSTNANTDGAVDLGITGARFKDIYLSGGVYLGGTGSANKLDDYEEGTWTPVVSSGSVTVGKATYTKIGNLVMVQADVVLGGTRSGSNFYISGLPFANGSGRWTAIPMYHGASIGSYQQVVGVVNQGDALVTFQHMGGEAAGTDFTNTYLNISGTYMTN